MTEIQPGREPTLAEVRTTIVNDLSQEMAQDDLVTRANRVEDALAGGASIEDASQEAGIRITKTRPIDIARKVQSGGAATGLPEDARFIETAFSLNKGATSNLVETADGGYFMVRVDEVIEAAKRPLDQVRNDVVAAWKTQKLNDIAKKTAEEIRDAAKGGPPLAEAGREVQSGCGKQQTGFPFRHRHGQHHSRARFCRPCSRPKPAISSCSRPLTVMRLPV